GSLNTAIGNFAMGERESGSYNTAVGGGTLWNTNNDLNTGIGYQAGLQNVSGTNNTYMGANAFASFDNLTNSTAIGASSFVNASNKVRIGSSTVTVIEGQVTYTIPSDGRFKTAVTETVSGLDFITKLRPVTYNFQTEKYDAFIKGEENKDLKPASLIDYSESEKIRHSGFIAQEVVKAAREAGYEFDGIVVPRNSKETYGLAYSQFVVPLVKAVQEQQKQIDDLKKQIAELKVKVKEQDPER
ncbi:MAG TPA: tail fiber domain-containing protein, partial [Ferruginibacter sp.]|nr:tail fiber domain-containing protein [Ferruginibacter sp.]